MVHDVELVFVNVMRYNPKAKGHPVHDSAIEVRELFFKELDSLIKSWPRNREQHVGEVVLKWSHHARMSTSLETLLWEPGDVELSLRAQVDAAGESATDAPEAIKTVNSAKHMGGLRIQISGKRVAQSSIAVSSQLPIYSDSPTFEFRKEASTSVFFESQRDIKCHVCR